MDFMKIKITHFVNPHSWYYKCIDSSESIVPLAQTEFRPVESIELGNIFAVFYNAWKQYLLCRVMVALDNDQYIAWALDEGFPIRTAKEYIYLIPENSTFFKCQNLIQHAGIINLLPAANARKWSTMACQIMEELINKAKKIEYFLDYLNTLSHNWGELRIYMRDGTQINMGQYLIEHNLAIDYDGDFRKLSMSFETTRQPVWLDNDGYMKQKHNHAEVCNDCETLLDQQNHEENLPPKPKSADFDLNSAREKGKQGCGRGKLLVQLFQMQIEPLSAQCVTLPEEIIAQTSDADTTLTEEASCSTRCREAYTIPTLRTLPKLTAAYNEPHCEHRSVTMLPAGYDLTNLNKYNDPNHWHIRPSQSASYAQNATHANESENNHRQTNNARFAPELEETMIDQNAESCLNVEPDTVQTDIHHTSMIPTALPNLLHVARVLPCFLNNNVVLAHKKSSLSSWTQLSEANFDKAISNEMHELDFIQVSHFQSYAWPHAMRGNSLFIINEQRSSKTWCYLPVLAKLIKFQLFKRTACTIGPTAIVLTAIPAAGKTVAGILQNMCPDIKDTLQTILPYLEYSQNKMVCAQLQKGCGILVTTPDLFIGLLEQRNALKLFDGTHISHIVIDNMDEMLETMQNAFSRVLDNLHKICAKTTENCFKAQIYVTSSIYITDIMPKLMRHLEDPLLLMDNFLEAAVYGMIQLIIKPHEYENKFIELQRVLFAIINEASVSQRVLIVCNTDESVIVLHNDLVMTGCTNILGLTQQTIKVLSASLEQWKLNTEDDAAILICTDALLPELDISNVNKLIHYTFPKDWKKFVSRFAVMRNAIPNFVANNFVEVSNEEKLQSIIFLHDDNVLQLFQLVNFLELHNQQLDATMVETVENLRNQFKNAHSQINVVLCPAMLEYAQCNKNYCSNRHTLCETDLELDHKFPKTGEIRIEVVKVYSPTHFAACILQYQDSDGSWSAKLSINLQLCMAIQLYYSQSDNCVSDWPLEIGDVYVLKRDTFYERVRILEVVDGQEADDMQQLNVCVRPLDTGTEILEVSSTELLVCPAKYKNMLTNLIDIRLTGLKPNNAECQWCDESIIATTEWLIKNIDQKVQVQAEIDFVLSNCIFVKNLCVMSTSYEYETETNIKISLLKNHYALACDKARLTLMNMISELAQQQNQLDESANVETTESFSSDSEGNFADSSSEFN